MPRSNIMVIFFTGCKDKINYATGVNFEFFKDHYNKQINILNFYSLITLLPKAIKIRK